MNEETTVPSETAVDETGVPLTTEVPESVPETTDWIVAPETTEAAPTSPPVFYQPPASSTLLEEYYASLYEETVEATIEETVPETTTQAITIEIIESIALDQIHVDLFGSFLVCGTLIGLALLRDRHGN